MSMTDPGKTPGMLMVLMEAPASMEEEFNDWYDMEHFPQRSSLPGFVASRRWVCVDGWPRWLAAYDLVSLAALETPEYRAVSGANSTPWSKRVLPRTIGRSRILAQCEDEASWQVDEAKCIVVCRYGQCSAAGGKSPFAQARSWMESRPGVLRIRQFGLPHDDVKTLFLEFDRIVSTAQVATLHDLPAAIELLNIYRPYHRG